MNPHAAAVRGRRDRGRPVVGSRVGGVDVRPRPVTGIDAALAVEFPLGLRVHWAFDIDTTLCRRKMFAHFILLGTTDLYTVSCTRCQRRIMKGETPGV